MSEEIKNATGAKTEQVGEALKPTENAMGWNYYDPARIVKNVNSDEDGTEKNLSELSEKIKKTDEDIEHLDNRRARLIQRIKKELRKDRNGRLIMWGAEFESCVGMVQKVIKSALPYLSRDQQKEIVREVFDDKAVTSKIIEILKRYTDEINEKLTS